MPVELAATPSAIRRAAQPRTQANSIVAAAAMAEPAMASRMAVVNGGRAMKRHPPPAAPVLRKVELQLISRYLQPLHQRRR